MFSGQLVVLADGFANGKTLADLIEKSGDGLRVTRIRRGESLIVPLPDPAIHANDRLLVRDSPENLKEFEKVLGTALYADDTPVDDEHPLVAENQQIAEIVVVQGSPLENTTLSRMRFADQYQLITLALHRAGRNVETLRAEVGDVLLRTGQTCCWYRAPANRSRG